MSRLVAALSAIVSVLFVSLILFAVFNMGKGVGYQAGLDTAHDASAEHLLEVESRHMEMEDRFVSMLELMQEESRGVVKVDTSRWKTERKVRVTWPQSASVESVYDIPEPRP